jgi:hypothetical protein
MYRKHSQRVIRWSSRTNCLNRKESVSQGGSYVWAYFDHSLGGITAGSHSCLAVWLRLGYYPSGLFGILLVVVIVLLLIGIF